MSISAESRLPDPAIAIFERSENTGTQAGFEGAGMGFKALAFETLDDPDGAALGEVYFNRAIENFNAVFTAPRPDNKYPTGPEINARGELQLEDLSRAIVVGRQLSGLHVVRGALENYMQAAVKQARVARELIDRPRPTQNPDIFQQYRSIVPALNTVAVVGLLLHHQIDALRTWQWTALPNFYGLADVRSTPAGSNPVTQLDSARVYTQKDLDEVPAIAHRIYVRDNPRSQHDVVDDDTAVIWASKDPQVSADGKSSSAIQTIYDLANPTRRGTLTRLRARAAGVVDALEERTYGSIKDRYETT